MAVFRMSHWGLPKVSSFFNVTLLFVLKDVSGLSVASCRSSPAARFLISLGPFALMCLNFSGDFGAKTICVVFGWSSFYKLSFEDATHHT